MSPAQANKVVDALMADSERITDAVMLLVDHANQNGVCFAVSLGWVNRLFATIETRMAEQLMDVDEDEDEVIEPLVYPVKPGCNPARN